jgi:mRNA interferase RelE/StbE
MYKVLIKPSIEKFIYKLTPNDAKRVLRVLKNLAIEPRPPGCLKLTVEEGYRIRAGIYRILYEVNDEEQMVIVYRIKHRKDVYR